MCTGRYKQAGPLRMWKPGWMAIHMRTGGHGSPRLRKRATMRIGGMKAVFAGYFTAMLFQVYGTAKYQVEWNETEEIDDEIEKIEA